MRIRIDFSQMNTPHFAVVGRNLTRPISGIVGSELGRDGGVVLLRPAGVIGVNYHHEYARYASEYSISQVLATDYLIDTLVWHYRRISSSSLAIDAVIESALERLSPFACKF
jgi:hypothetical protein